jgi:cyclopropane-fatty-acyl-phospholipid synthase
MSTSRITASDPVVTAAWSFLHNLLGNYHPRDFAVRFWDGTTWNPDPGQPTRFTLVLKHPGALRRMFWPPSDLTIGEAYIYDDFDIEGDIAEVSKVADYLLNRHWGPAEYLRYGL